MATNNYQIINTDYLLQDQAPAIWPALDLPLIEDLANPFSINDLATKDFAGVVQRLVSEAVRTNNVADACELISRLRMAQTFKQNDPQRYNYYQSLIILLKFVSLAIRNDKTVKILLNENLIYALKNDIDVVSNLQEHLFLDEGGLGADKELRRGLIYSFEHNQEKLGQHPLILDEGNKVSPTVQNWLKSYNNQQHLDVFRSKFNQINYLNTNADARDLNDSDKAILKQVLEMYDKLLFPPPGPEVVSDGSVDEQNFLKKLSSLSLENFELPKEVFGENATNGVNTTNKTDKTDWTNRTDVNNGTDRQPVPPVVPAPKNVPEKRGMEDIGGKPSSLIFNPLQKQGEGTNKEEKSFIPNPSSLSQTQPNRTSGRPVNIQDILKDRQQEYTIGQALADTSGIRNNGENHVAGLRMGDGQAAGIRNNELGIRNGNTEIKGQGKLEGQKSESSGNPSSFIPNPLPDKQPVAQNEQSKQTEIDKKLEELQKRTRPVK